MAALLLQAPGVAPRGFASAEPGFCQNTGGQPVSLCLKALLQFHCASLSRGNPGVLLDCASAGNALVRELQPENLPIPAEAPRAAGLRVAAFRHELESFFASAQTERWLQTLQEETDESYRFQIPRSLWSASARFFPSEDARLRALGVVFQSVTPTEGGDLHFHLMKLSRLAEARLRSGLQKGVRDRKALQIQRNLSLYRTLVDSWRKQKIEQDLNPAYALYPPVPQRDSFDPTLHHFTVPAHLSRRLLRSGRSPGMAFFAPFLFNTLYEIRKIDRKLGMGRWPFLYPAPFWNRKALRTVEMNLRKIYTGYAAAAFGARPGDPLRVVPLDYPAFRREFARDPSGFMRAILREARTFR